MSDLGSIITGMQPGQTIRSGWADYLPDAYKDDPYGSFGSARGDPGTLGQQSVNIGGKEYYRVGDLSPNANYFKSLDPSQFTFDPVHGMLTSKENLTGGTPESFYDKYAPWLMMAGAGAGIAAGAMGAGAGTAGFGVEGGATAGIGAGATGGGAVDLGTAVAGAGGGAGGYVDTIGDAITGGQAGVPTTGAAPIAGAGAAPGSTGYMDTIGDAVTGADSGASLTGPVTPNYWELISSKFPGLLDKLPGILSAVGAGAKPGQGGGAGGAGGVGGRAVEGIQIPARKVELEQNPYMKPQKAPPMKSLGDYLRG